MIIFVYGVDEYRSKRQINKMIEKFKKDRDPQGLNCRKIDCNKMGEDEIYQEIMTPPFLAEKRLLVLENFLSSKHKKLQERFLEKYESAGLKEDTVLVFFEEKDKFRSKLQKTLCQKFKDEPFSQNFEKLSGREFAAWLTAELAERGFQIDGKALIHFQNNQPVDMWKTSQILEQITNFSKDKIISLETLKLFLEEKQDDNIFALIDAIFHKRKAQIFSSLEKQKKEKDAHFVFAMVIRQIKILFQIKEAESKGIPVSSPAFAKQMGLHPFALKKSNEMLRGFSLEKIKALYEKLTKLDKEIKTGLSADLALDSFVFSLLEE